MPLPRLKIVGERPARLVVQIDVAGFAALVLHMVHLLMYELDLREPQPPLLDD